MSQATFGLLEMGSNSLKLHLVRSEADVETSKIPWGVAHEFFRTGHASDAAIEELIACLRAVERIAHGVPLPSMIAIATGVFREIPDMQAIAESVRSATGVRVRVISGEDEAKLMARDFRGQAGDESVFLLDLGGATSEWAWFEEGALRACGSVPLGAIRNEYLLLPFKDDPEAYLARSASLCDGVLAPLPVPHRQGVVAIGGSAKAAAKIAGAETVPREDLEKMIRRVQREGPPESLKPARRAVFLPGLVILWRVLVRCDAPAFRYGTNSVKGGLAGRLMRVLGTHRREDLHATLILETRESWRLPDGQRA